MYTMTTWALLQIRMAGLKPKPINVIFHINRLKKGNSYDHTICTESLLAKSNTHS